jgi:hypothetical protein
VVNGLVKKNEAEEIKKSATLYPDTECSYGLVDLKRFVKIKDLNGFTSTHYIEKVSHSDDMEETLYPVTTRPDNFQRPWLTPRRHLEYSFFWGCTATMGIGSIIFGLRKL